jgi:hypothetical protein
MHSEAIERLLPDVFQAAINADATGGVEANKPLRGLLGAMEELHGPVEAVLQNLSELLNPIVAPSAMVHYLAGWVDLYRLINPGSRDSGRIAMTLESLRLLVASGSEISGTRGTAHGVISMLEVATGVSGFRIEENVTGAKRLPRDAHLRIVAPSSARSIQPAIDTIVRAEKPAHVTYEIAFDGKPPKK